MHRSRTQVFIIFVLAFIVGLAPGAWAQGGPKAGAPPAPGAEKASKSTGDYVGSDTCLTCHEEQAKHFRNTVMGRIFANPRTAAEKLGCESCHGPGKVHVDAGGGKGTIPLRFSKEEPADLKNQACLTCHEKGQRMFWKGSPHETRGLACVDCHQVMTERTVSMTELNRFKAPIADVEALRSNEPELCLTCHQMRRAQLQRSSHMPFREGKVTCSSCHNPHGTPNPKQLIQSTANENCYSCHAERRGPFVWEHPPVMENCLNCHDAHGSTNPQLLKVREPRLCNQCHLNSGHPSNPYGIVTSGGVVQTQGIRVINRGCTTCHSTIHGSNSPSGNHFRR
jgi:DmsE family decaheme c-type cytochrome